MELSGNIMNGNGGSEQEIRPRFQGTFFNFHSKISPILFSACYQ